MAWYPDDLPSFPTISFTTVQESREDPVQIVAFGGEHEQRISYAGPNRRRWEFKTATLKQTQVDTFDTFWVGRQGQNLPFKLTWRGTVHYVRFDGAFTITWKPPQLAQIAFAVKEMHPSEIIQ